MDRELVVERSKTLTSLVDWLQFTLPFATDLNQAYDVLGMPSEEFLDMPRGLFSYAKQKACSDIRILYEGTADMGIHIQMSGQGCREYESYYGQGWESLFERIVQANGKFTRLDLAIDEKRYNNEKPYFTIGQLIRKVKRNECRSKFKTVRVLQKIKIEGGENLGNTIYFGSPLSDIQARAYEKNHERENAGHELEDQLTSWNRFELQMSDDRAQAAVETILMGISSGAIVYGILSHYIDFLDRDRDDSNKARWNRTKFWDDYLAAAQKLRLAVKAPDKTIDQKDSWLKKQVYPTLSEVWVAYGCPGEDYLAQILTEGMDRMTEAQWQRAEEFMQVLQGEKAKLDEKKRAKYEEKERQRMELVYRNRHRYEFGAQPFEAKEKDSLGREPLKVLV